MPVGFVERGEQQAGIGAELLLPEPLQGCLDESLVGGEFRAGRQSNSDQVVEAIPRVNELNRQIRGFDRFNQRAGFESQGAESAPRRPVRRSRW